VGGVRTLPFMVVAAKSLASVVASDEDRIECVVVHASGYDVSAARTMRDGVVAQRVGAYRFLELLQKLMCLVFLRAIHVALHSRKRYKYRRKCILPSGSHTDRRTCKNRGRQLLGGALRIVTQGSHAYGVWLLSLSRVD